MEQPPRTSTSALATITWSDAKVTIRFTGPAIGGREGPILRKEISPYLSIGTIHSVVLDLAKVTFMSDAGLEMLFTAFRASTEIGFQLILYRLTPDIQTTLVRSGLDQVFTIVDSPDALALLIGS